MRGATGRCRSGQTERVGACHQARRARNLSRSTRPSCALVREGACHVRSCLCSKLIPVVGYLDDLIIVPLGILAVVQLIPPEIMEEHRATAAIVSERPVSRTGAVIIVLIWIASIAIAAWLGYRYFGRWK
jgi:hypothetical protein